MKRAVLMVVILIAAAAIAWTVTRATRPDLGDTIDRATETSDPGERIAALVDITMNHRGLGSEDLEAISDGIADAAYERGEADGLVAACDSLLALQLPAELAYRLKGQLHDGLVIQGYRAETDKHPFYERATSVARDLLTADDVPPDVRLQVASFHGYALDFVTPEEIVASRGQWMPYELAARGFGCLEGPVTTSDTSILSSTLDKALTLTSAAFGTGRALALTDSLLAAGPCPTMRAVILANRYGVAAEEDPEIALLAATELLETGKRPGMWPLLRSVSLDLVDRGLAPETALELADAALGLVDDRADSGRVFFAVGQAQRALSNFDEAAVALEKAVTYDGEAPELEDPRVAALLETYAESSNREGEIGFLARLLARSVLPNEEAKEKLASLLETEGRSRDEISSLVASQRYAGVREATDFTLVDRAGNDVSLSGLRGNVVLLCFWSYG